MVRVSKVRVVKGFEVEIEFTDGTSRIIDLSRYLDGPMFEPLKRDPELFGAVTVDREAGTIVWPNGADKCSIP